MSIKNNKIKITPSLLVIFFPLGTRDIKLFHMCSSNDTSSFATFYGRILFKYPDIIANPIIITLQEYACLLNIQ